MSRRRAFIWVLMACGSVLLVGLSIGLGQQSRPADDSRAEFLKSFRRL